MSSISLKTDGRPPLQHDTRYNKKGSVWVTCDFPESDGWG